MIKIFIDFVIVDFLSLRVSLGSFKGILDVVFSVIIFMIVIDKIALKKGYKIEMGRKALNQSFWVVLFLITGYILLYDTTLAPILSSFKLPEIFQEYFKKKQVYPVSGYLSIVIVAPIFEEIIFRGFILKQLLKKYDAYIGILLSSFLFALIHANIPQGVNAFLAGILLGLIYFKTRSLILCMLAHLFNNAFSFFGYYIWYSDDKVFNRHNFLLAVIGTLLLGSSIYILFKKPLTEKRKEDSLVLKKIKQFVKNSKYLGLN